jgi:hypothetical protein
MTSNDVPNSRQSLGIGVEMNSEDIEQVGKLLEKEGVM